MRRLTDALDLLAVCLGVLLAAAVGFALGGALLTTAVALLHAWWPVIPPMPYGTAFWLTALLTLLVNLLTKLNLAGDRK
jgi:hypothetical protein